VAVQTSIFLVGFMGAGKSTVGRALAALLSWDFIDLDQRIEERDGRSVPKIFEESGAAAFREIESAMLAAVAERPRTIVALGGGAWTSAANRAIVAENGVSVFLDASLETIKRRVTADGSRPLFGEPESVTSLYAERLPLYRTALMTVPTDGRTVDEIVHEILKEIKSR
jgi:shikimate kinase